MTTLAIILLTAGAALMGSLTGYLIASWQDYRQVGRVTVDIARYAGRRIAHAKAAAKEEADYWRKDARWWRECAERWQEVADQWRELRPADELAQRRAATSGEGE